jgi:hypothetical protein
MATCGTTALLVAAAIREHELRVALGSGLLGAVLLLGTWHAIWMYRQGGAAHR